MEITINSFSLVNTNRFGYTSFAIKDLNESNFSEDLATNLENFLSDNNIVVDMFNIEYMSFLTGKTKLKEGGFNSLVILINKFLKTTKS